jgi:uncharacterized protein (TIGR02996 family)
MTLAKLEAAVAAKDLPSALVTALELWRGQRSPALAAVVDAIAARIRAPKLPRGGIQLAWAETKPRDPVMLGTLLAAVAREVPVRKNIVPWRDNHSKTRMSAWCTRLQRLAKWPDDPRVAAALVELVRDPPFEMGDPFTGKWLYEPALELVTRIGDPRGVPLLQGLLDRPTATTKNLRDFFTAKLPAVIDALPDPSPLDRTTAAACDRLLAALGGRPAPLATARPAAHEEPLLEAVLADPDNDAPRAVLADYWLELGDPRGELMALQLKRSRSDVDEARIRTLVRGDKTSITPELARVTKLRVYRRGLLDEFTLVGSSAADAAGWQRAAADRAMWTVRTIHRGVATEATLLGFLRSPAGRSLRDLPVNPRMLAILGAGPTAKQITGLVIEGAFDDFVFVERNFPALRRLTLVRGREELVLAQRRLELWPGRTKLDTLGVSVSFFRIKRQVTAWLRALEALAVPALVVESSSDPQIRITLRSDRTLELDLDPSLEVLDLVTQVPRIRRLVIRSLDRAPVGASLTRFRTALKKLAPKQLVLPEHWPEITSS